MVRLDSATHPDGESSDAALLRNVDGDAAAEVGTSAPQDADAEKVAGAGQSPSTSKDVMDSAAKAEVAAIHLNAKEAIPIRHCLEEMGHQ